MRYRDQDALVPDMVEQLERENHELREELRQAREQARHSRDAQARATGEAAKQRCAVCGGNLLPVAVFAGGDPTQPHPLQISTLRFSRAAGGYTHGMPVRARVCASCGFLHQFVDLGPVQAALVPSADEVAISGGAAGGAVVVPPTAGAKGSASPSR